MPNHDGQCARPHGHTYKLEVYVRGEPQPLGKQLPNEGMVIDFEKIKDAYKELIEPMVEHQDLNVMLEDMIGVTTCEHLARWCCMRLLQMLPRLEGVRLWETPTSYAEYWN